MRIYKIFLLVCAVYAISGCTNVVYQHRDMAGNESTWGNTQIYCMWVNGWFKTNISNPDRHEYSPDVHHQSKEIVFLVAGNKIHIMDSNGNNVMEVPNAPQDAGRPRWSRGDAKKFILFSHPASSSQSAIYLITPDGNSLMKITSPSLTQKHEVVDSIDDNFIVFSQFDSANNQDRDLYVKYIWSNQAELKLTDTPDSSETLPVVSHDGKLLAYRVSFGSDQDDQVHVAQFNGPQNITVLHTIDLKLPADINISGIDFSRDDQELFISTQAEGISGNLINRKQEIFRVDLDGDNQMRLTNNMDEDSYPSSVP